MCYYVYVNINIKNIFLIDAVGALFSAVFLGLVLPRFVSVVKLPIPVLHILGAIALLYSIYSFLCYRYGENRKKSLLIIIIANTLYCILTSGIVLWYIGQLGWWGYFYFFAEISIILLLIHREWKVLKRTPVL